MDDSGPVSAEGSAVFNPDGWYETPDSTVMKYVYSNGVVMNCRQTPGIESKKQGTEFVCEKGSVFVWRGGIVASSANVLEAEHVPDQLVQEGRIANVPKEHRRYANYAHVQNFIDCVKSRDTPSADISIGHRSATVCHLGNIAVRTGKKINWNPKTEMIEGDAEASKWLTKEYRKPYEVA